MNNLYHSQNKTSKFSTGHVVYTSNCAYDLKPVEKNNDTNIFKLIVKLVFNTILQVLYKGLVVWVLIGFVLFGLRSLGIF